MPHMREVKTCDRCRHFKRRCDLLKPSCTRCISAGVRCSFDVNNVALSTTTPNHHISALPSASSHYVPAPTIAQDTTTLQYHNQQYLQQPPPPIFQDPNAPVTQPTASSPTGLISPTTTTESDEPRRPSIAGVTDPTAAPQRIVRKRKRNCLSCLRCHRLKVKCDKELPCGRCKSSGNGRECYYTYNKGPNGGKFPCPSAPTPTAEDKKTELATWQVQHKVRGSSHWRDLMTKIAQLTPMDSSPLAAALEDVATNACLANFSLPGNFPFGTPGAAKYAARDAVVRLIASERANCPTYINTYFELLDCVNPIVDHDMFMREVDGYWADPNSTNLCWLSQFLMVLGLGCFSSGDEPPVATELLVAAEACLMQTPFMFRPTLLTLKTLCLAVIAKQVCNPTCWACDSWWTLMGLLVRASFIYGLPQERDSPEEPAPIPEERDARRKLWLTILYMDIKGAMCTGMPPLTRPDELGSYFGQMPDWGVADSLQMVLYQSIPTVLTVVAHINSKSDHVSYAQLRELMGHAQRVCTNQLQRITVDIFLRRCLMVLQRPFALHNEGPVMFPESYWSSLECSLALLMHYRDLYCHDSSLKLDLVGRAFVLDFFSATLTTYVHLLRADAPLTESESSGCVVPPRQIIHDTLRSCVDIWAPEKEKSVCYRTGYNLLEAVFSLLPESNKVAS